MDRGGHSGLRKPGHPQVQRPFAGPRLYATRAAVATCNRRYIQDHVEYTNGDLYECPAVDISVGTGAPLPPGRRGRSLKTPEAWKPCCSWQ